MVRNAPGSAEQRLISSFHFDAAASEDVSRT
jgi:hypothetical protein